VDEDRDVRAPAPAPGGSGGLRLAAGALAAALGVFALDVWLPLGVAVPSLYLGVVLLGLWSPRRRFVVVAALVCGALTLLAPFVSPGGRPPAWIETLNRPLMLVPLLLGALLLVRHQTVARRLARQEADAARERREADEKQHYAELARSRAESLARVGEMAAVVAHEVRNPLAGIKGVLQVVGGRLPLATAERRALQEAASRLDSLQRLTQDLLLFARPRPPAPGPVVLSALAREVAALVRADPTFGALDVEVVGDPGRVIGDAQQLRTVVTNLLRNGAEASGESGRVVVEVRDGADEVALRVSDSGPGVPESERERIFEPFHTTRAQGTGLGLAIVRRVVEAHGGTVTLEEAAVAGACFSVRLPRAIPGPAAAGDSPTRGEEGVAAADGGAGREAAWRRR
jgi:signal transduction histidine kinase